MWWYSNGKKKYEGSYINDKKDGLWLQWDESGTLKLMGHTIMILNGRAPLRMVGIIKGKWLV